jgi:hypothetical protein
VSTTTTNFNLIKPELTDAADITAMNSNWDVIDEVMDYIHKGNNIQSFYELSQFGLSDDDMSPTDFASNIDKIVTKLDGIPTVLSLILNTKGNPNLHASVVQKLCADTTISFTTDAHVGWLYIRFSGETYRPVVIETNLETANHYDCVWSCVYNKGGNDGNQISKFVVQGRFYADITYPNCLYQMVDNWKEWLNPPMVIGTKYRTTERYSQKPVFVGYARYSGSNVGGSVLEAFDTDVDTVIDYDVWAISSDENEILKFPVLDNDGKGTALAYVSRVIDGKLVIQCVADMRAYTFLVKFKYTKKD